MVCMYDMCLTAQRGFAQKKHSQCNLEEPVSSDQLNTGGLMLSGHIGEDELSTTSLCVIYEVALREGLYLGYTSKRGFKRMSRNMTKDIIPTLQVRNDGVISSCMGS